MILVLQSAPVTKRFIIILSPISILQFYVKEKLNYLILKVTSNFSKMWAPIHMRKIFVGGIDYTTTDESLKEHFSTWGEVVDAVVMKDLSNNR